MRIVIVGGHGQIARQLGRLTAADGHEVIGLIRVPEQGQDLESDGFGWKTLDLEDTSLEEMTDAIRGADTVVFAAGGGADGNVERKETVDKGGAVLLTDACREAGVRRYVMVSAMGTEQADPDSAEVFDVYLRAKAAADDYLRASDLGWTVVRPGKLTDEVPSGRVSLGDLEYGSVSRGNVAHVLAEVLDNDHTIGMTFSVLDGDTPAREAVATL